MLAIALLGSGCQSSLEWLGMKLIFDPARWPADRIVESPYGEEDPTRQRFALYLPEAATAARGRGEGWPTLVFVHGGGWTEGSIDLETAGQPIYGNIGGFYAGRGYGVALVEYRLQEEPAEDGSFSAPAHERIGWRDQVRDVAHGVAAVRREVARHGGDPDLLVLSGHSAGAQLASYVSVVPWPGEEVADLGRPAGVVAISGAGYDLADPTTYELGADPRYYEARFRGDAPPEGDWQERASAIRFLDTDDPPFLVFYAGREYPSLQHQARLLDEALRQAGISTRLSVVPRQGHRRIVVTFSQGDHPMTRETLAFLDEVTSVEPARPATVSTANR